MSALSTRFELAIFSVTGRRELQASLREHSVADQGIEPQISRCKRDAIPFRQSATAVRVGVEPTRLALVRVQAGCSRQSACLTRAAVQGIEPRLIRSERIVRTTTLHRNK